MLQFDSGLHDFGSHFLSKEHERASVSLLVSSIFFSCQDKMCFAVGCCALISCIVLFQMISIMGS